MRILMLVPHAGIRGPVPRITQLLAKGLRAAGCEVSTEPWGRYSDKESQLAKVLRRGADVIRVRRAVTARQPECVVVHTSHEWASIIRDLALLAAIRARPARIVLQFHGGRSNQLITPGHWALKRATSMLLALSDAILVLSSEEFDALSAFCPEGLFRVVSNPFEGTRDGDLATSDLERKSDEPPLILFVGRLVTEKGVYDAIDAMALLPGRLPARLLIAGTGPAKDKVAAYIRQRGLSDQVMLGGHLQADHLRHAYAAADVFVLPTYHPEGFPTAITEAMSAGLPIITTKTRGIADHLDEGTNAIFVPPRDSAALSRALERVLDDALLRKRMAEANRKKVDEFAPSCVAAHYLDTLREIAAS